MAASQVVQDHVHLHAALRCPKTGANHGAPILGTHDKGHNNMRIRTRLFITALTAALALMAGAGVANAARSFSVTNNTLLTYTSSRLEFIGDAGRNIICDVTLTASLHATGAKTRGTLVGFVNGSRTANCTNNAGGTNTLAIALVSHARPWHLTLNSFRGTLPRITEVLITVNNAQFLFQANEPVFGRRLGCLYAGNIGTETRGRTGAAEYTVETLVPQRGNTARLVSETLNESLAACDANGELVGSFRATLPPVIRLI